MHHPTTVIPWDKWHIVAKKCHPHQCNELRKTCKTMSDELKSVHKCIILEHAISRGRSLLGGINPIFMTIEESIVYNRLQDALLTIKNTDIYLQRLLVIVTTVHLSHIEKRIKKIESSMEYETKMHAAIVLSRVKAKYTQAKFNQFVKLYERKKANLNKRKAHLSTIRDELTIRLQKLSGSWVVE